ncbi:MAG TPA: DUF87 domain-containing protein [Candidatus Omnitrophota bacterium]|nr:DUF87 domain-containing protein [Candidatus Omnitrophota bacterium]
MTISEDVLIGYVREIKGAKLKVVVPDHVVLGPRMIHGQEYVIGRMGSFVRIPVPSADLFGIISDVGEQEAGMLVALGSSQVMGHQWMEVELVGESDRKGKFQRGVGIMPLLNAPVHAALAEDMSLIYGKPDPHHIQIGTHAAFQDLPAAINVDNLVTRHSAILGSTGSGKSNTVALILKALTQGAYPSAQIVVIDPHGEYKEALGDRARVFSINDAVNRLYVPYWAMTFDELAWFLVDRNSATESQQDKTLRDKIYEERKNNASRLKTGSMEKTYVTPDSPVPYDLRKVWYDIFFDEYSTYLEKDNYKIVAYKNSLTGEPLKGSIDQVIPPQFETASLTGTHPPYPSPARSGMGGYLNKMMMRLKDHSFDFLLNPGEYDGVKKDLGDLLDSWIGHPQPITVLDFSETPFEVMDLVVGTVTKMLFQAMFWGRSVAGVGRQRPLLIVFEEAHAYLSKSQNLQFIPGYSRTAVQRVFKEGRKYGVGGMLVSQRPSELDPTIISQAGTILALRISNNEDRGIIEAALPEALTGLTNFLSALRTGEAIIAGEAVNIPSRIRIPLVEPRPSSRDAEPVIEWSKPRASQNQYEQVVSFWRTRKMYLSK